MSKWKPGQSGNPKGRAVTPTSTLIAKALKGNKTDIIRKLEELANDGDTQAAKWLAEKLYPSYKQSAKPISLPDLCDTEATLTDKAHAILAAVGAGIIAPDVGRDLLGSLGGVAKIVEIDDILKRLDALEDAQYGTSPT